MLRAHESREVVDLFFFQRGIDPSTPSGRSLHQMLVVFTDFERSIVQSRARAYLARIKAGAPTKSGKRIGRPSIVPKVEAAIRQRLATGQVGMLKVAAEFGVGSGTVQRIKRQGLEMLKESDRSTAIRNGIARVKAMGVHVGRPAISADVEAKIRERLVAGTVGMNKIATELRVGSGTVQRVKRGMK